MKNADMMEGRGPMIYDKVFRDPRKAHNYIINQPGIMDTKPQGNPKIYITFSNFYINEIGKYSSNIVLDINRNYNGYDIKLEDLL